MEKNSEVAFIFIALKLLFTNTKTYIKHQHTFMYRIISSEISHGSLSPLILKIDSYLKKFQLNSSFLPSPAIL